MAKMRYAELKQAYDRLVQENIFLRQELERLRTAAPPGSSSLSTTDKVHLSVRSSRGREDVYAVRFSNSRTGKSGYVPSLTRHGLKPPYRPEDLLPLTDPVIYQHFLGRQTIGLYPLLLTEETWLLAVDFDKADWLVSGIPDVYRVAPISSFPDAPGDAVVTGTVVRRHTTVFLR